MKIICPKCNKEGKKVQSITVRHMILESLKHEIKDEQYYLCINEECDAVYYNSTKVYVRNQVIVPVWFKKDANPKYICYCNKVTEQQIIDAVINKNARDIRDIIMFTGAMKNGKCLVNNPAGECCGSTIKVTINKVLILKK